MPYFPVCKTTALPIGERIAIEAGGLSLVVCNIDGEYFALENRCSHEDLPPVETYAVIEQDNLLFIFIDS